MSEYWPVVIIVLQLIFLEGILSIDNAAVIGALVSPLPDDQRVSWPRSHRRPQQGGRTLGDRGSELEPLVRLEQPIEIIG